MHGSKLHVYAEVDSPKEEDRSGGRWEEEEYCVMLVLCHPKDVKYESQIKKYWQVITSQSPLQKQIKELEVIISCKHVASCQH